MGLGAGGFTEPLTSREASGKSPDFLGISPLICGKREIRIFVLAGLWGELDERTVVKALCKP